MRFGVNLPGPFFVTTGGGRRGRRRSRGPAPYTTRPVGYQKPRRAHRKAWAVLAAVVLLGATIAFWYVMLPVIAVTAVVLWRRPAWRLRVLGMSRRALTSQGDKTVSPARPAGH